MLIIISCCFLCKVCIRYLGHIVLDGYGNLLSDVILNVYVTQVRKLVDPIINSNR